MSFSYEDFYLSGFNSGSTDNISGIQQLTPLYWIITGLKYDGTPVTTADFSWFTGIVIADSGTLTPQSGFMGYDAENDDYRGILTFDVASGLTATGCIELYWNSGSAVQEGYALEKQFDIFSNKNKDAWDILTNEDDSVDNADLLHSHAGAATQLQDLTDVARTGAFVYTSGYVLKANGVNSYECSSLPDPIDVTGYESVSGDYKNHILDSTAHINPTGYETVSGDYLITSGTVSDYAYVSGRYTLTSGSYNTHITTSTAHHDPTGYETVSGDYNITSGTVDDYMVVSGDYATHQNNANAHHTPPVAGDFAHNSLAGIDAGDIQHITVDQKNALHIIYSLEVHNNDHHDPDHLIDPILLAEIAEQDTPAANKLVMWIEDFAGHTVLRFRTADGHIHTIGECMHKVGRNTSGTGIARGKIVYYNGTTTGRHPNFSLAKADALATMPVIGITLEAVNDDAYAELMIMGRITGLDTSAWAPGTVLYASATVAGGLTDSFPPHPYLDQQIGIVEVQNAGAGVILIDIRVLQGRNDGTIRQSFSIGDGASGDVTLKFDGDAGNDGSIVYDVSDDEFDFDRQINMNTKKIIGVVDPTADQDVATKKFTDDHNWAEADIIDLDKYNQATVDSKDVAVGDRFDEQSAAFPGAPSEGDLHYDEDLDSLYRYNAEAEAWIEIGVGGGTSGDNLGSHIATQDLDMANFKIVNLDIKTLNAAERTTTSDTYAKLKETMVQVSGTITFYWQMKKVVGGVLVFSKLYVNGAAVGVEKSSLSTDYVNYSDSIAVTKGDLVQLYGKKQDDTTCYVRNFYLENFGNINWSY